MASLKKRILSLILCTTMVFGLTPNMSVAAQNVKMEEKTTTEQEEKIVRVVQSVEDGVVFYKNGAVEEKESKTESIDEDSAISTFTLEGEDGCYWIENFEDLKQVPAGEENNNEIYYAGTEPLVIDEDYIMPEKNVLYMCGGDLSVLEGVTFSGIETVTDITHMEVEGTLEVEHALRFTTAVISGSVSTYWLEILGKLELSGSLYCDYTLNLTQNTEISDWDKITFGPRAEINMEVYVENWEDVLEYVEIAKNNPHIFYDIISRDAMEDIVVSESVTVPKNMILNLCGIEITVAENVEFCFDKGVLNVDALDVKGTFVANTVYANEINVSGEFKTSYIRTSKLTISSSVEVKHLDVSESLNVSGTLVIESYWNVENRKENPFEINGYENIQFGEDCRIDRREYISTFEELKLLVTEAKNSVTNTEYCVNIEYDEAVESFVINESIEIPEKMNITFEYDTTVVIEKDCTFTMNNSFWVDGKLIVNGILENNEYMSYYGEEPIRFANKDAYKGTGAFWVSKNENFKEVKDAIVGLDLSDFELIEEQEDSWGLRYVAGLIKLGTPTEVTWGYNRFFVWDDEKGDGEYKEVEFPGGMKIVTADPWQAQLQIDFYQVEDGREEQIGDAHWRFGADEEAGEALYLESFCMEDPESGTYYFEVTQEADYIQYCDGDTVRSDYYTYVKPDKKIGTCTNLQWDGITADYEAPENTENIGGYEVQWLFAENLEDEPEMQGGGWTYDMDDILRATLHDEIIQDKGDGYYYFRVRALSRNIEIACNGEWSELSPAYFMTDVVQNVNNELNNIMDNVSNGNLSQQDVMDAVQSMNTEELRESMLADQNTVRKIAELENFVGGQAPVNVTKDASDFDPNQISIIGANLNKNISEEPISLVIDKPEKDNVIPELYDSAVAVKFSMTLENVEDAKNLQVPVEITLPVPKTINPRFLVVLHYHADGSVEELRPYVYEEGGQYFATFVLTSFSDFVLTEIMDLVGRISGATRYETGYKVADQLKEVLGVDKFEAAVVATGKNFADALAGSYLAIQKNAPILLTNGKADNIATLHDYIKANVQEGGNVYILGGEGAVPAEAAAIDGYHVVRLAGKSRYETNIAILSEAGIDTDEIIVATGKSFADSLSASAIGVPILLVKPGETLNDEQKEILKDMKFIGIVGGTGAVSEEIEAELGEICEVSRISGKTRYETSVALAENIFGYVHMAVIASGKNFPDGLCGGPLAAAMGVPLILTADGKTDAAASYIAENEIEVGVVLGGTGALSDESVNHIFGK